jgi:hypothetical protein
LRAGDYVLMRGTLWQDGDHGEEAHDPGRPRDGWEAWPPTYGHGGWLEIHPVDWIIRLEPPAVSSRQSGTAVAMCTEPGERREIPIHITLTRDWAATRSSSLLQARSVDPSIDPRFTAADTIHFNPIEDVVVTGTVRGSPQRQGRFKGSWRVSWREIDLYDKPWLDFDDSLPPSAQSFSSNESWVWRGDNPLPYHGKRHHVSTLAKGIHQHWFHAPLAEHPIRAGDILFTHVYLSGEHPPRTIMLQWHAADSWEH